MVSSPDFDFQHSTHSNAGSESGKKPLYYSLLIITAILVIVCQLAAMVIVANGQVEKSEQRNALLKARFSASNPVDLFCVNSYQSASAQSSCPGDGGMPALSATAVASRQH